MQYHKFLATLVAFSLLLVVTTEGGQPRWSNMLQGNNIYTISTETWEECGSLCTRNFQRIETSLVNTECTAWTWYDPSNRHYAELCRFYEDVPSNVENGQTISGNSGCYSLSTC